jgi:hypothetical protein
VCLCRVDARPPSLLACAPPALVRADARAPDLPAPPHCLNWLRVCARARAFECVYTNTCTYMYICVWIHICGERRVREGEREKMPHQRRRGGSAWLHGLVHAGCALALYSSHVGTVDLCGGCWFTVTQITADLSKAPASVFIDGGGIPNIIMTCNKLLALEHSAIAHPESCAQEGLHCSSGGSARSLLVVPVPGFCTHTRRIHAPAQAPGQHIAGFPRPHTQCCRREEWDERNP